MDWKLDSQIDMTIMDEYGRIEAWTVNSAMEIV